MLVTNGNPYGRPRILLSLCSSPYKSSTQNVKSKCWDLCPNHHGPQSRAAVVK
ncbi:hypothetical protein NEUTE1DRAFT_118109, partial [Neurospora tetrasperma FGSC 2508]